MQHTQPFCSLQYATNNTAAVSKRFVFNGNSLQVVEVGYLLSSRPSISVSSWFTTRSDTPPVAAIAASSSTEYACAQVLDELQRHFAYKAAYATASYCVMNAKC
eukprot:8288-Heterococcus_DN1.PRE.5